jgi:hypothetical protein
MPKAPPKTRDFDWKETVQTDYLGVSLMHLEKCMEPVVRALDVGFGHTLKFVSGMDGSEVRCAHFPSVAYPTESDQTTDPMGGRRKTVGIPIDGLIYEVGSDVHLAADVCQDVGLFWRSMRARSRESAHAQGDVERLDKCRWPVAQVQLRGAEGTRQDEP